MGFGYSGTLELHYQNMRKRYDGCTYVHGNLEITNLDDPVLKYDLDFLSSIKYVSGYVLIGLSTQVRIKLNWFACWVIGCQVGLSACRQKGSVLLLLLVVVVVVCLFVVVLGGS